MLLAESVSVYEPARALDWIVGRFGEPPYHGRFPPGGDGTRHRWRLIRVYLKAMSLVDPQRAAVAVDGLLDDLRGAKEAWTVAALGACGVALRRAGRVEESIGVFGSARTMAATPAGCRDATLNLAEALRSAGAAEEGLVLARQVAAERRQEYGLGRNLAVLVAEREVVFGLVATGRPSLPDALDLRARQLAAFGWDTRGAALVFLAVARTFCALGQHLPALANARAALVVTAGVSTVSWHLQAETELLAADVGMAVAASCADPQWAAGARDQATSALIKLRHAFGPKHPAALAAELHPSLR